MDSVDGAWGESVAGTRSADRGVEVHPLTLALLDNPLVWDVLDSLFDGHASLIAAYFRHSDAGAAALAIHADYPKSWPLYSRAASLWCSHPGVVAISYPSLESNVGCASVIVVPESHRSGSHPHGDLQSLHAVLSPQHIEPGDVLLLDARLWHGVSVVNEERLSLLLNFGFSWIRRPREFQAGPDDLTDRQRHLLTSEIQSPFRSRIVR